MVIDGRLSAFFRGNSGGEFYFRDMYVGWQSNLIFGSFCFDWIGHLVWKKRSGVGKFVGNLFWKMLVYWDEDCVYILE